MKTLPRQTSLFGEDELMSLPVDSHARMQALPSSTDKANLDLKVIARDYGERWCVPSKRLGPDMSSQRTSQTFYGPTMAEIGEQYSMSWPDWGTMQSGELQERQRLVRPIIAQGFIWLLTPVASDSMRMNLSMPLFTRRYHRSAGSLPEALHRLGFRGHLNPAFPGWMMGFPPNWTASPFQSGETNPSKPMETP